MIQSRIWIGAALAALALLLFATPRIVLAQDSDNIAPNTEQSAKAVQQLDQAVELDHIQAQSYKGGDCQRASSYYTDKAAEAEGLMAKLGQGQSISKDDLQKALDTSEASHYTGGC